MLLAAPVKPDYEAFLKCLRREGTPDRVHLAELFLDPEMKQAVVDHFHLDRVLDRNDPHFSKKLEIRIQHKLGYDYVTTKIENFDWTLTETVVPLPSALSSVSRPPRGIAWSSRRWVSADSHPTSAG